MSQINIDFQIVTNYNPKYLIVWDTSDWQLLKGKPAIIEITVPGFKSPITHYFTQNEVNSFNSINLGLSCTGCGFDETKLENLPDGIYNVTVKGSPSKFNFTRLFLKTDNLRLKLDEIYMKYSMDCSGCDSTTLGKIQDIEFMLNAAESNMRAGNECTTQELMFKAEREINKLKKCRTCV